MQIRKIVDSWARAKPYTILLVIMLAAAVMVVAWALRLEDDGYQGPAALTVIECQVFDPGLTTQVRLVRCRVPSTAEVCWYLEQNIGPNADAWWASAPSCR